MEFFDSHCHLDPMRYGEDLPGVLERARAAGVAFLHVIGTRAADSAAAAALVEKEAGVTAAAGIHPNDADDATDDEWHSSSQGVFRPSVRRVSTGIATPPALNDSGSFLIAISASRRWWGCHW